MACMKAWPATLLCIMKCFDRSRCEVLHDATPGSLWCHNTLDHYKESWCRLQTFWILEWLALTIDWTTKVFHTLCIQHTKAVSLIPQNFWQLKRTKRIKGQKGCIYFLDFFFQQQQCWCLFPIHSHLFTWGTCLRPLTWTVKLQASIKPSHFMSVDAKGSYECILSKSDFVYCRHLRECLYAVLSFLPEKCPLFISAWDVKG